MKLVLHLDDDPVLLEEVRDALEAEAFTVFSAANVTEAEAFIAAHQIDFAVVDLFLEGNDGDELSNDFIRAHLQPRGILYGRMTSAPGLVPADCTGCWVMPKAVFRRSPYALGEMIRKAEQKS